MFHMRKYLPIIDDVPIEAELVDFWTVKLCQRAFYVQDCGLLAEIAFHSPLMPSRREPQRSDAVIVLPCFSSLPSHPSNDITIPSISPTPHPNHKPPSQYSQPYSAPPISSQNSSTLVSPESSTHLPSHPFPSLVSSPSQLPKPFEHAP